VEGNGRRWKGRRRRRKKESHLLGNCVKRRWREVERGGRREVRRPSIPYINAARREERDMALNSLLLSTPPSCRSPWSREHLRKKERVAKEKKGRKEKLCPRAKRAA